MIHPDLMPGSLGVGETAQTLRVIPPPVEVIAEDVVAKPAAKPKSRARRTTTRKAAQ